MLDAPFMFLIWLCKLEARLGHVKGVIENVCESIKYVIGSTSRMKDFETSLAHVDILDKRCLNFEMYTHWNSIYFILRSAKEVKHVFNYLERIDKNYKWCPSKTNLKNYDEIEGLLEMFYQATNIFSMSKHSTTNQFFFNAWKSEGEVSFFSWGRTYLWTC